jgi:hypothetical protein
LEEEEGPSLFGCRWMAVLPLSAFALAPLTASVARGHQCLLAVLHDANLCPCHWHFHCEVPSMASLACFQCSHLDVQFLFHASCFFSFWAVVAHWSPLVRSKKAKWLSSLRSSKMYTDITFLTFEIGQGTSATVHLTR